MSVIEPCLLISFFGEFGSFIDWDDDDLAAAAHTLADSTFLILWRRMRNVRKKERKK